METQLSIPESIGIKSADLLCALGNLLDLAMEGCAVADSKTIRLTAVYDAPALTIVSTAPDAGQPKDPMLSRLAERYGGSLQSETKDGVQTVRLLLKEAVL